MGQAVQFWGVNDVLEAFDNRGALLFSVFQGKQFMFKGFGYDDLKNVLKALEKGRSSAIYTIKVYDNDDDKLDLGDIKSNTPDDGSFNFKVLDLGQEPPDRTGSISGTNNLLLAKLSEIEDRLNGVDDENDEPPKNPLNDLLIAMLPAVAEKLVTLLDLGLKKMQEPKRISEKLPDSSANSAMDRLKRSIPDFDTKIEKLADFAEREPDKIKMVLNSL